MCVENIALKNVPYDLYADLERSSDDDCWSISSRNHCVDVCACAVVMILLVIMLKNFNISNVLYNLFA